MKLEGKYSITALPTLLICHIAPGMRSSGQDGSSGRAD